MGCAHQHSHGSSWWAEPTLQATQNARKPVIVTWSSLFSDIYHSIESTEVFPLLYPYPLASVLKKRMCPHPNLPPPGGGKRTTLRSASG